ncbi:iron chaperone [Flavihumibacter petaseus]|uniref:YdhG-like domain-containing protein n=1 Tax=Flavihumibacter petaseus NBRC 106054 TaxID=1220578 RepID=A0A0E9N2V5_9BACT|nr:DUF1801 domain-containing protein [Flavihumibacter petaseus]GAO44159.1 hypothetical protein FPE01S_03_01970 [Flavihumibacter petaseus NBRC 106054]
MQQGAKAAGTPPADIDAYIAGFDGEVKARLEAMRDTIRKAAPAAVEAMAYGMPTFKLKRNLVHFAAAKKHIGFYPAPSGVAAFEKELAGYVTSKGAIQFPLEEKLPLTLVAKIVKFRVKEEAEKAKG